MFQDLDSTTFEKQIKNDPDAVILDVRTAGELNEGMIPGAEHIDLMGGDFVDKVKKLDPNKAYYVYCRSGNRSATACSAMGQWGFNKLYNLSGGMMSWMGEVAYPQSV